VNIGYQVVTGTGEMNLVREFAAILANWLVVSTHRSIRGSNRCSAGRLVSGESSIGVSGVLAFIRPGVKSTYYLTILFDTVTNFVGNIVGENTGLLVLATMPLSVFGIIKGDHF